MCVHSIHKRTPNVLLSPFTLCPWDRVSHNEAGQPVVPRGSYCLYPSHPGGCRHSWPCLAFHVVSGATAFKSSCLCGEDSYHHLISPTPEKQSCIGHYINIDGIYTLGPLLNAKNQLKSHINKDTYFIILSVEVAIRDGIAGSIHHAGFITTECCSVFKRLRDGKLELSSSVWSCCMRNTRFIEVYT